MATQRKFRRILWLCPTAASVVLVCATVVIRGKASPIDPAQPAVATRGDIARSVVATGKVQPITKVEVKSKFSGIVSALDTDINGPIRKGQLLAQLDQKEILDQVAAQKATLEAAESNAHAAAGVTLNHVNAEAPDLPEIRHTAERARQMQLAGVVSAQAFDDANGKYLAAANTPDRAVSQIAVDTAKLHQAEAQVAQAQAAPRQLEQELSYTSFSAPMDGEVLSRDVEKGDAVSSILVNGSTATLIMTIGDTHQVYVQGKVDEANIGKVYLGQPARIKSESFRDRTFLGRVTRIAPLGVEKDNVTTFEVRVSIDNPGGELKTNMTANAEILLDEHKDALTVPEQAVKFDKDRKATVQVPDPRGKSGRRDVAITTGLSNGSRIEVLSGLKPNDGVILQQ